MKPAGITSGGDTPAPEIQLQTKTVDPDISSITVLPDPGYDGLSAVTVTGYDVDGVYDILKLTF